MARREKWSTTTAAHQQKGQHCGSENGSQETHQPVISKAGTAVKSHARRGCNIRRHHAGFSAGGIKDGLGRRRRRLRG